MAAFVDIAGQRFGRLIAVRVKSRAVHGVHALLWLCQCDCGKMAVVATGQLRNGNTKSCGCLSKEAVRKRSSKHGQYRTGAYSSWMAMKTRCFNERSVGFKWYGGRGIRVCERWRFSFENFLNDMGPRPSGHSIERININGNYEPTNCKWIPREEESKNQRQNGGTRQRRECNQMSGTTTKMP